MSIYMKHNYLNKNIKYIKNGVITEYDMKNGGISILHHNKYITEKEFEYLNSLDKLEKNVIVGKWLKDNPDISKALMEGFIEAREIFFEENEIEDSQVLAIKKDAIFLIDKIVDKEVLNEDYTFRKKNQYTSYIKLSNNEFYYSLQKDILDIKGFDENVKEKQKDHLFKFIKECLELDANGKDEELFIKLLEFKDSFVNKKLPLEYYYDIKFGGYLFKYENFHMLVKDEDTINRDMINEKYFNFNINLNLILELISILLN